MCLGFMLRLDPGEGVISSIHFSVKTYCTCRRRKINPFYIIIKKVWENVASCEKLKRRRQVCSLGDLFFYTSIKETESSIPAYSIHAFSKAKSIRKKKIARKTNVLENQLCCHNRVQAASMQFCAALSPKFNCDTTKHMKINKLKKLLKSLL